MVGRHACRHAFSAASASFLQPSGSGAVSQALIRSSKAALHFSSHVCGRGQFSWMHCARASRPFFSHCSPPDSLHCLTTASAAALHRASHACWAHEAWHAL
ncbi:MAG: hypothetical protein DYG90_10665 [Chloroflexi bacterium CFX6]|nr:hypothetical protein [Chloroflexi bacterium CFX6]